MSSSAAHDCTSALVYRPSYVLPPTSLLQGNNCLYLFFLSYCLSCSWRLFILKSYYCTILSYQVRVCKGNPYEPTAQTGAGSKNSASLSFFLLLVLYDVIEIPPTCCSNVLFRGSQSEDIFLKGRGAKLSFWSWTEQNRSPLIVLLHLCFCSCYISNVMSFRSAPIVFKCAA